eukprot:jgi/Mesvir1/28964/Mv17740-RA.1
MARSRWAFPCQLWMAMLTLFAAAVFCLDDSQVSTFAGEEIAVPGRSLLSAPAPASKSSPSKGKAPSKAPPSKSSSKSESHPKAAPAPPPEFKGMPYLEEALLNVKEPDFVPAMCTKTTASKVRKTAADSTTGPHGISPLLKNIASKLSGKSRRLQSIMLPSDDVFDEEGEMNGFLSPPGLGAPRLLLRYMLDDRASCKATAIGCGPEGRELGLKLRDGSLGRCAIIGLGDGHMKHRYGKEIDAHDTVIRLGSAPIKGYEYNVGSKTTINFVRALQTQDGKYQEGTDVWGHVGDWITPDAFFVYHDEHSERSVGSFVGKPFVRLGSLARKGAGMIVYRSLLRFAVLRGEARMHLNRMRPSNGLEVVLTFIRSRLCTFIDLYGFSKDGTGYYFPEGAHSHPGRVGMHWSHVAGLEYYVYRVAQANNILCIRGDH